MIDAAPGSIDAMSGSPDAGSSLPPGCDSLVTPSPSGTTIPSELRPSGFYRCGGYGSGGARIIEPSRDQTSVALVTDAGDAYVLAATTLRERARFSEGHGRVTFAGLSADGSVLATVEDKAGEVALWNVSTGALLHVMPRTPAQLPFYDVGDVDFAPDGARVAVGSSAGLNVYDVATGAAVTFASDGSAMTSIARVAYVADGARLLVVHNGWYGNGPYVGGGAAFLVDAADGGNPMRLDYEPWGQAPYPPRIGLSDDGHFVALGAEYGGPPIGLFDTRTGAALPIASIAEEPVAVSDDGTRIATRVQNDDGSESIVIRTVADGAEVSRTPAHRLRPVTVIGDLGEFLVGDEPPHVLTSSSGGTACGTGHGEAVKDLAQTSDGATLVEDAMENDGTTTRYAWDVGTGDSVTPPGGALETASPTSPDGTTEAREQTDNSSPDFDLVDASSGAAIRTFGPHETHPDGFDFSPDGALIASSARRDPVDRRGSPLVKLWNASAGTLSQDVETSVESTALFHTASELFVPEQGTVAHYCR